jgi:hypothetical protein
VLQGLYKFRFTTERGEGSGVMFATAGGRLKRSIRFKAAKACGD